MLPTKGLAPPGDASVKFDPPSAPSLPKHAEKTIDLASAKSLTKPKKPGDVSKLKLPA